MKGLRQIFLFAICVYASPLSCGNMNGDHTPAEHGKVNDEFARGLPRPYYRGSVDASFAFSATYTYWVPSLQGLIIAYSNAPNTPVNNLASGNVLWPDTYGRSGFKVDAAKYLHFDDWKWSIGYTWFYNPTNLLSHNFDLENVYRSPWINSSYIDLTDVHSSFSNQFNIIKGTLDRRLALSQSFIFTPFGGLVGAWETSRLKADIDVQRTHELIDLFSMSNTMYWWCVGPYAGVDFTYRMEKYISLFLKTGTAINLAKRDVWQTQNTADLGTPEDTFNVQNLQDHLWAVEPMFSGEFGVQLDYAFKDLTACIDISWELQTWFSHMGFLPATDMMGYRGNYSMQGLNVSLGIIF